MNDQTEIIWIDTDSKSQRWYIVHNKEGIAIYNDYDGYYGIGFKNKDKLENFIEQLIKVKEEMGE